MGTKHVCLSADQFAENLLESNGADVKRSRLEGRNGILDVEMDSGVSGPPVTSRQMRGCRQQRQHLRQKITCPKCEHKECTRKHSGSQLSGQKSAELLDARHVRLPVRGSHTLVNVRRIKMPGTRAAEQHQRRRRNAELLEIPTHDRWTRLSSSTDPNPKRSKTTSVTDNENLAGKDGRG